MDNIQYFKSSWGDIKNSPGWFGKLCLLALLNFIPVFGQIVAFGYLYGWAREIAWGTHAPLPAKIFANEDGKLYRRGWFIFVLSFVVALVPTIVISIGNSMQATEVVMTYSGLHTTSNPVMAGIGTLLNLVGVVGAVLLSILAWVGYMRISIYDRLSAGFQLGKIWKMARHDTGGLVRIFGMALLFGFVLGIVLSIVFMVLIGFIVAAGVSGLANAGYSLDSLRYMSDTRALNMLVTFIASAGVVGFLALLIGGFISSVASLFVDLLVARALGYWTMQFNVPIWGGQDDPLPFELDKNPSSDYYQEPSPVPQSQQPPAGSVASYAPSQPDGAIGPQTVVEVDPIEPVPPVAAPVAPIPMPPISDPASEGASDEMPRVTYEKPLVVGAEFIMSPDELEELRSNSPEAPDALDGSGAHGAHGVQDGQASDAHVGEDGQPHVGRSEHGQD